MPAQVGRRIDGSRRLCCSTWTAPWSTPSGCGRSPWTGSPPSWVARCRRAARAATVGQSVPFSVAVMLEDIGAARDRRVHGRAAADDHRGDLRRGTALAAGSRGAHRRDPGGRVEDRAGDEFAPVAGRRRARPCWGTTGSTSPSAATRWSGSNRIPIRTCGPPNSSV